jgi:hypothetical protein
MAEVDGLPMIAALAIGSWLLVMGWVVWYLRPRG